MKTKSTKHQNPIPSLVKRGFTIHQQLGVLNEEFKKIKERLKEEAIARPTEHVPLLEKDSGGTQWIAYGNGCECRVVFPETKVKTDIDPNEVDFLTVRSLAGNHFKSLFQKVTIYRPIDKKTFRAQVNTLLTPKAATELLELCTSESEPKAVWKACPTGKE